MHKITSTRIRTTKNNPQDYPADYVGGLLSYDSGLRSVVRFVVFVGIWLTFVLAFSGNLRFIGRVACSRVVGSLKRCWFVNVRNNRIGDRRLSSSSSSFDASTCSTNSTLLGSFASASVTRSPASLSWVISFNRFRQVHRKCFHFGPIECLQDHEPYLIHSSPTPTRWIGTSA